MQTATIRAEGGRAWYREPWPWILIAIPAVSVILGIAMVVLAVRTDDGLVTGDYYRQGLAINKVLERDAKAQALGLRASIGFDASRTLIRAVITGKVERDRVVRISFAHPTRAGFDRKTMLVPDGTGTWEGRIEPLVATEKWHVTLEEPQEGWRLTGVWHTEDPTIVLGETR